MAVTAAQLASNGVAERKYLSDWIAQGGAQHQGAAVYDPHMDSMHNSLDGMYLKSGQMDSVLRKVGYDGPAFNPVRTGEGEISDWDDPAASQWLKDKGYTQAVRQWNGGHQGSLLDASGNVVDGSTWDVNYQDDQFGIASLIAASIVTGGVAAAGAGTGAGAAAGAAAGEVSAGAFGAGLGAETAAGLVAPGAAAAGGGAVLAAPTAGAAYGSALGAAGAGAAVASGGATPTGFWNGTDFTGATPMSGSSNLGSGGLGSAIKAGVSGMNVGDWVQLAGLGASLWASNNAQNSADAYSADLLNFSKQQYADNLPYIKAAQGKSLEVADAQLASMKQADALAKDYADYNKTTFRPLEQAIVADSMGYDTPERRRSAADSAVAEVDSQAARTRDAAARTMAANGVNPGSTRALAAMQGADVAQAGQASTAAFQARKGVEDTGYARKVNAVSLGRNLPANQNASANTAINAGNAAVGSAATGATVANGATGLVQSGIAQAGNLQARADDAATALWGNFGNVAGRYITSDRNMKTDIEEADPEQALQQVTGTPVSDYKYDPAKMAAAGIPMPSEPGTQETGAMAQDVNATMGEEAAPGGKKINVGTLIGKTMLAVQALDQKVNSIARMIQSGGGVQAVAA